MVLINDVIKLVASLYGNQLCSVKNNIYVIVRMNQQGFYAIQRPKANVGKPTHKLIIETAGRGNQLWAGKATLAKGL